MGVSKGRRKRQERTPRLSGGGQSYKERAAEQNVKADPREGRGRTRNGDRPILLSFFQPQLRSVSYWLVLAAKSARRSGQHGKPKSVALSAGYHRFRAYPPKSACTCCTAISQRQQEKGTGNTTNATPTSDDMTSNFSYSATSPLSRNQDKRVHVTG